jgi:hypothetical protein
MSVCVGMVSSRDFVAAAIGRNEVHRSLSLQDQPVHNLAERGIVEHDALSDKASSYHRSAERHESPGVSVSPLTRSADVVLDDASLGNAVFVDAVFVDALFGDAPLVREMPQHAGRHT